tara:strand:+ start:22636 stop:22875 length:240 start_codon:yes stop_codon:yes gene_type:complete
MSELDRALDKITPRLLDSLDYGEEYKLTPLFTLYHYESDDFIVVNLDDGENWEELLVVMYDDRSVDYEIVDNYLYNKYA